jgi:hypothetical protein
MAENHITDLLDEKPFSDLSDTEQSIVESHILKCIKCKSAFESSRIASFLIEARTAEITEAGPFFKTRVMAEIRARQLSAEEPALMRMWKAARVLVTTMALVLVVLAGITIFTRATDFQEQTSSGVPGMYSPEYVVLARGDVDDELANDQVLQTIYDLEDSDGQ